MSGRGRGFRRGRGGSSGGFRRTLRDRSSNQDGGNGGGIFGGRNRRRTQQETRGRLGRFSQTMQRRTGRPTQRPSGSEVSQASGYGGRFRRNDGGFSNNRGGRGRGGQRGGRGGRGGRGRGQRGGRGGRGGRGNQRRPRDDKQFENDLDKELDAYMNKNEKYASAQLDAELEEYQAQK